MSEGEEKTEQPSEHKLREARKKGQVAKSADVVALASLFFTMLLLSFFLPYAFQKVSGFFYSLHKKELFNLSSNFLLNASTEALDLWVMLSLPLLFFAALGAVIGNLGQFGFLLSMHPLKPDIKRIDPIAGFKKIFSKDKAVEFVKQIIKFTVVFVVIYHTLKANLVRMNFLFRMDLLTSLTVVGDILSTIIIRVLLCFLAIAVFDFFWQRYSFTKSMRMSKYEVKKEYKQQEGDPHIKSERRRIQQEALEAMSSSNVKDASVVITNPSHLAIALRYEEQCDDAPKVIAKGIGLVAKAIIEQARQSKVPVLRNVPLARELQWLEINEEIPKNLYDSVAEVLTFIHELSVKNNEQ